MWYIASRHFTAINNARKAIAERILKRKDFPPIETIAIIEIYNDHAKVAGQEFCINHVAGAIEDAKFDILSHVEPMWTTGGEVVSTCVALWPQDEQMSSVIEWLHMTCWKSRDTQTMFPRVRSLHTHTGCDYRSGGSTFAWCLILSKRNNRR